MRMCSTPQINNVLDTYKEVKIRKKDKKTIHGSVLYDYVHRSAGFSFGTLSLLVSFTLSRDSRLKGRLSSFWSLQ